MTIFLSFLICGVFSYLIGAIPFGYIIARSHGINIRAVGSRNIGATNVFRSVSKSSGILTFICDALKGFIPVYIFPHLLEQLLSYSDGIALAIVCCLLAISGHNWPIYLRFKGGKGMATSAGALAALAPKALFVGLCVWIIVFFLTRYVSAASISALIVVALLAWFFYTKTCWLLPAVITALALLGIWRHKENIRRLMQGTENRFTLKKRTNHDLHSNPNPHSSGGGAFL